MIGVPAEVWWVKDLVLALGGMGLILGQAQWVKDQALPQLWHRLQLRLRFNPWPKNFLMPQVQPNKGKKKKKKNDNFIQILPENLKVVKEILPTHFM